MTKPKLAVLLGTMIIVLAAVVLNLLEAPLINPLAETSEDVRSYFLGTPGLVLDYAGEGNEFAPFTRRVQYAEGSLVQLADENPGTTVVRIFRSDEAHLDQLYSAGEFYTEDNLLGEVDAKQVEMRILERPLRVGHSWGQPRREILEVGAVETVPAGKFFEVVKVGIEYPEGGRGTEYYAKNIGLIKRVYEGETGDFQVVSELQAIELPVKD